MMTKLNEHSDVLSFSGPLWGGKSPSKMPWRLTVKDQKCSILRRFWEITVPWDIVWSRPFISLLSQLFWHSWPKFIPIRTKQTHLFNRWLSLAVGIWFIGSLGGDYGRICRFFWGLWRGFCGCIGVEGSLGGSQVGIVKINWRYHPSQEIYRMVNTGKRRRNSVHREMAQKNKKTQQKLNIIEIYDSVHLYSNIPLLL